MEMRRHYNEDNYTDTESSDQDYTENDRDETDLVNFKGIHNDEGDEESKYFDPISGAHFEYSNFWNILNNVRQMSEDVRYQRNNNSNYYSSDSDTQTTASCLGEGSAIVTTPTVKSNDSEEEKEELVIKPIENNKRPNPLNNIKIIKPPTDYTVSTTKKVNEPSIPKLLFPSKSQPKLKIKENVKRISKVKTQVVTLYSNLILSNL